MSKQGKMIASFVVVVANFAYTMYVCGKNYLSGCSGDIVEIGHVVKRRENGKFLSFFFLKKKGMCVIFKKEVLYVVFFSDAV